MNQASCSKSPTGAHVPYDVGISYTTLMIGPNKGTDVVSCSWCGLAGVRSWHEEARPIKGHGPFATRLERVEDSIEWPVENPNTIVIPTGGRR